MLPNFRKSETQSKNASAPTPPPLKAAPPNERIISVLKTGLTINGDLISAGELRIEGEVEGDIKGARLVIGEHARITGNIVAEDVIIFGQVMGSVRGLRVSLQSTSHIEGDVYHQALVMEQGAFFEGKSIRSDEPLASEPRQNSPDSPAISAREAI